jgi:hypothetical protein
MEKKALTTTLVVILTVVIAICIGMIIFVTRNQPLHFIPMGDSGAFVVQGETVWHLTVKDGQEWQIKLADFSEDRLRQMQRSARNGPGPDEVPESNDQARKPRERQKSLGTIIGENFEKLKSHKGEGF